MVRAGHIHHCFTLLLCHSLKVCICALNIFIYSCFMAAPHKKHSWSHKAEFMAKLHFHLQQITEKYFFCIFSH